jgi:hypothetical protein
MSKSIDLAAHMTGANLPATIDTDNLPAPTVHLTVVDARQTHHHYPATRTAVAPAPMPAPAAPSGPDPIEVIIPGAPERRRNYGPSLIAAFACSVSGPVVGLAVHSTDPLALTGVGMAWVMLTAMTIVRSETREQRSRRIVPGAVRPE